MLNRSKLYAVGLLLGVFTAGLVVGGAVSAAWGDRGAAESTARDRDRHPSYTDRLQQELDLTQDQRDSVERILAGYQSAMRELWTELRPRMDTIRTEVRSHIMSLLDDAQRGAYRARNARVDSIRAARDRNGRRGGSHDR
ncbi:MAG: periplasmic heavy metal sensor [Gemmatimonadetes bacterium]|nr:periplasmic heavy metal sensor [Gemmatimonadota bacterium]